MGKDLQAIIIILLLTVILVLSSTVWVEAVSAGYQWVRGITGKQCYLNGFQHGNITRETMLKFPTHEACLASVKE